MEFIFTDDNCDTVTITSYVDEKLRNITAMLNIFFKTEKYLIIGYQSFNKRPMLPFIIHKDNFSLKLKDLNDDKYFCYGFNDEIERNKVFEDLKKEDFYFCRNDYIQN